MKLKLCAFLVITACIGLALGAPASSASAHAQYVRSQPAENTVVAQMPIEVLIWFTEAIEIQYSEMQVVNASGTRVDNADTHLHFDPTNPGITIQPNLPPGTYTVAWRMLSAVDGHRTAGTFAFSVGQLPSSEPPPETAVAFQARGSAPPRWLTVSNRWIAFVAMAAIIGAVAFPALVLPVGLSAIKESSAAKGRIIGRTAALIKTTMWCALAGLAVTTALSLWLQSWSATGDVVSPAGIRDVWTNTRFGEIWTLRAGAIVAILLLGAMAFSRLPQLLAKRDWRDSSWIALGLCALALPLTTSLNSHAAAGRSLTELRVFVDWLHLAAGGLWIGGLLQLVLVSSAILPLTDRRATFLASVIPRFSQIALGTVAVIVTTGVIQWWQELRGVFNVFDSDYGYILFVKVMLLMPLLLLAAFNLLVVRPRFLSFMFQGVKGASSRVLSWERRFRWAVAAEVMLALVILGVTAILTETSTPTRGTAASTNGSTNTAASPTPSSFAQSVKADDLDISLDVYPGKAGPNDLNIFLNDANGDERAVQQVIVRYKFLDRPLGENEDFAEALHPYTHYVLTTSQLSLAGSWQIEVIVRREGLLDARGTFTVLVQA